MTAESNREASIDHRQKLLRRHYLDQALWLDIAEQTAPCYCVTLQPPELVKLSNLSARNRSS
ncbi:hypothetical protein AKJ16_DCAP07942 [Drosera capensis]